MELHIKATRLDRLSGTLRSELIAARRERGWSQAELGRRAGLPQMHISGIETGRIVPRFDTLLDLVRVLDRDFLLAPRALVPALEALIRDYRQRDAGDDADRQRPMYGADGDEDEDRGPEATARRHDEL